MGGAATTTTTTASLVPTVPVLGAITPLASPSDQTQVALSWSQPGGRRRGDLVLDRVLDERELSRPGTSP